jgi:hypothetical protein
MSVSSTATAITTAPAWGAWPAAARCRLATMKAFDPGDLLQHLDGVQTTKRIRERFGLGLHPIQQHSIGLIGGDVG